MPRWSGPSPRVLAAIPHAMTRTAGSLEMSCRLPFPSDAPFAIRSWMGVFSLQQNAREVGMEFLSEESLLGACGRFGVTGNSSARNGKKRDVCFAVFRNYCTWSVVQHADMRVVA